MMKLYDHQKIALTEARPILERAGVVLLACSCRSGKSLVALALAFGYSCPVLFVTKKAAIGSVTSDASIMSGWGHEVDLEVTSWDSLHKVTRSDYGAIICDEIHSASSGPKQTKRCAAVQKIFKRTGAKAILLSATPAMESICSMFHTFQLTCRGPWTDYRGHGNGFYAWFKSYGIPDKIRIAGGQEVKSYKKGKFDEIMKSVGPLMVTLTAEEAGFEQKPVIKFHEIENQHAVSLVRRMQKDGVINVDGRFVVGENPAPRLQKMYMIGGGTFIDDGGEAGILPTMYKPYYKAHFISERIERGKQYAIFTHFMHERVLLKNFFGSGITDSMEDFKAGKALLFVGSIKTFCEGVDLSWISGAMILYSLSFSGTTFHQICQRMQNKKRKDPIHIHVLGLKGGFCRDVFEAVNRKEDFNTRLMRWV